MSRRAETFCAYGISAVFIAGVAGVFLAALGEVPRLPCGVAGVVLIALGVLWMFWSESKAEPTLDTTDCICDPEFQRDEASKFPDYHRPACPVRQRWEAERRDGDCGCGPPVPKQRNFQDPRP